MIITHKEFPEYRKFEIEYEGRPLKMEVGKMAELCNAAVLVTYGETTVLVTCTASARPKDGIDYFPLAVDFNEKLYAVGRIPGSFMRREGKPSLPAVLASRLIDRPMRPLFPSDLRNDVVIACEVLSVDRDCSPEITAMIGASAAVSISDVPFNGPIAGIVLGWDGEKYLFNPTQEERKTNRMTTTIAATHKKIVMIESEADQVPEDVMYEGIVQAHEHLQPVLDLIDKMVAEIGKPKFEYEHASFDEELFNKLVENEFEGMEYCMDTDDKNVREARVNDWVSAMEEKYSEEHPDIMQYMDEILYKLQKKVVKKWLLAGKRVDGRAMNEIRPLGSEVGLIPRVHGSALFTRGQTQVLSIATLATLSALADVSAAVALVAQACAELHGMVAEIRPPRDGHDVGFALFIDRGEQCKRCGCGHALSLTYCEILHDHPSLSDYFITFLMSLASLFCCHVVGNGLEVIAEAAVGDEFLLKQRRAHGKGPGSDIEHGVDARIAVYRARYADLRVYCSAELASQLLAVYHVTVCEYVKALDALGHKILRVFDDLLVRALKDARAARYLADKGQVCHAVFPEQLCNGIVIHRAHEVIKAAVYRSLRSVKAARLVIGNDLEEGGLAGCLHRSGYLLHLVLRQTYVLKAPELYRQILALLEYLPRVLHGHVVVSQHDYDLWFHFLRLLFVLLKSHALVSFAFREAFYAIIIFQFFWIVNKKRTRKKP